MINDELRKKFKSASSAAEKGRMLEELASVVFGSVPGVIIESRRVVDEQGSQEIDIVCWNDKCADGFPHIDVIFIIECKNWTAKVGSSEVAWFDTKIENGNLSLGFLIVAQGITGNLEDRSAAHRIITDALRDGREIIVFTADELLELERVGDLIRLIKTKRCQLVAGRALPDTTAE